MAATIVDARGSESCPQPVLMTMDEIKKVSGRGNYRDPGGHGYFKGKCEPGRPEQGLPWSRMRAVKEEGEGYQGHH